MSLSPGGTGVPHWVPQVQLIDTVLGVQSMHWGSSTQHRGVHIPPQPPLIPEATWVPAKHPPSASGQGGGTPEPG
jgi:hypothetical protein